MLNNVKKQTQLDIANIIKATAYFSIKFDNTKKEIAENAAFDLMGAFNIIANKNILTQEKFIDFLSSISINCSSKECRIMWHQLFGETNEIQFKDFEKFILPFQDFKMHQQITQNNNINRVFLRDSLKILFEQLYDQYKQLNELKKQLSNKYPSSVEQHQLWKLVSENSETLTRSHLVNFFQSVNCIFSDDEWTAICITLQKSVNSTQLSQHEFNQLILCNQNYYSKGSSQDVQVQIQQHIQQKIKDLNINIPTYIHEDKLSHKGIYNFRKEFDPIRQGRPQFDYHENYYNQLRDFKERILAPSLNYNIQYRGNKDEIPNHDTFFKDYYLLLHQRDKEELLYNRLGRKFIYEN